jgi:tRNA(Ile)-lysidine synthase
MQTSLESIPDTARRVFVAYSGGLDSSVLLHLLLAGGGSYEIIPWHVNHGLVEVAGEMENFCIEQSRARGLELRIDRLDLAQVHSNVEAEARRQRYQLFRDHCRAGDCVLTAHHADDQAETFLLNALRGSGVAGLRGIAARRELGEALLLRPLLPFSRAELEIYAHEHEIRWFNDPSNRSLRYDRNYLRCEIMPLLSQRWPGLPQVLASSCEIQAQTQQLLDEIAARDLASLRAEPSGGIGTLSLPGLLNLTDARRVNLLRYWAAAAGAPSIPQARLRELLQQLHARADAQPEIGLPGCSIRIYDERLFLVMDSDDRNIGGEYDFGCAEEIEIVQLELKLTRGEIFARLEIEDRRQALTLKFRRRGERNSDRHRLKHLFQEHRVPPWERDKVAQVYLDGRLEGLLV